MVLSADRQNFCRERARLIGAIKSRRPVCESQVWGACRRVELQRRAFLPLFAFCSFILPFFFVEKEFRFVLPWTSFLPGRGEQRGLPLGNLASSVQMAAWSGGGSAS